MYIGGIIAPLGEDLGNVHSQEYVHIIKGQNGVYLVREISPWSSHVLCIGLVET